MRRWIVPVLIPLLGAALALAGLIYGGQWLRLHLTGHQRYTIAVTDIDCSPPEGMDRTQFLSEVAKLADLPERLPLLDQGLAGRLETAFARHPWVEEVEDVQILRQRQIRVRLRYRIPVLAVPLAEGTRVVDGRGVLLPATAQTHGLPKWRGPSSLPAGPAGAAWGDPALETAAEVAGFLHSHQEQFHLDAALASGGEVTLTTSGRSRILWGRPPGKEQNSEAPASVKLERLIDYCRKHGNLDYPDGPLEYDVRPARKAEGSRQ